MVAAARRRAEIHDAARRRAERRGRWPGGEGSKPSERRKGRSKEGEGEESSEFVSGGGTPIFVHRTPTRYIGEGTPFPQGTPMLREDVGPENELWWEENEEVLKGNWSLQNKTIAQVGSHALASLRPPRPPTAACRAPPRRPACAALAQHSTGALAVRCLRGRCACS